MPPAKFNECVAFRKDDADRYGVNEAILLSYFDFWVLKNSEGLVNEREGKCYTYTSNNRLHAAFPFFSKKTVQRALNSLIEHKQIEKVYRTGKGVPGGKTIMITLSAYRLKYLKTT